jgi:hypothetical protein
MFQAPRFRLFDQLLQPLYKPGRGVHTDNPVIKRCRQAHQIANYHGALANNLAIRKLVGPDNGYFWTIDDLRRRDAAETR